MISASSTVGSSRSSRYLFSGTAAQFVGALAADAQAHGAVHHEYLQRFSQGDLPCMRFAIADFSLQYATYSSGFTSYLQAVINSLHSAEHRHQLQDNLAEEQGLLDDTGHHIPHAQLFERFRRAAGVSEQQEAEFRPCVTATTWRDLFLQKCQSSQNGVGLGAIGIGTELVVSAIYTQIRQGLREHSALSDADCLFFDLHIDCDDGHADELLRITEDLCSDAEHREAVRFGAISALNLRNAFWDVMLSRSLGLPPVYADGLNKAENFCS